MKKILFIKRRAQLAFLWYNVENKFVMDKMYNKSLKANAANLRKNMTEEERKLWYDFLRGFSVRFYRQKIIGRYIVDFYCAKAKLVIELDGSQHYTREGEESDEIRTRYLKAYGIKILRFSNLDISTNFKGVCQTIFSAVEGCINSD